MLRILHNTKIDFIRRWRTAAIVATAFTIPAVVLILMNGFNWSIEFTGGTRIQLKFAQAPNVADVRAVLTNAGGPGILAADACEAVGLELPELAPATVAELAPLFPPEASVRNPLDMIASASPRGYRSALAGLLSDPGVDAALAIFVPPLGVSQEDVTVAIASAASAHPEKTVFAVLMGHEGLPQGRALLHDAGNHISYERHHRHSYSRIKNGDLEALLAGLILQTLALATLIYVPGLPGAVLSGLCFLDGFFG